MACPTVSLCFFPSSAGLLSGRSGGSGFGLWFSGGGFRLGGDFRGRCGCKHFLEKFGLLQVLLRRWRLLVPVIVIVIVGTATHFRRRAVHNRNDGVIGDPAALNAVVAHYVP